MRCFLPSTKKADFAQDRKHRTSVNFARATTRRNYHNLSQEESQVIKKPCTYGQANAPPRASLWEAVSNITVDRLDELEVLDLVPITSIPKSEKALHYMYSMSISRRPTVYVQHA